jgi:hypothetical protein
MKTNRLSQLNNAILGYRLSLTFPNTAELFEKCPPQASKQWVKSVDRYAYRISDDRLSGLCAELGDLGTIGWNDDELMDLLKMAFAVDVSFPAAFLGDHRDPSAWLSDLSDRIREVQTTRRLVEPDGQVQAA